MSRRFLAYLGDVYNNESVVGLASISSTYTLADWLEPIFMSEVGTGEIGELRLIAHKHPEDGDAAISAGQAIRIMDAGIDAGDDPEYNPVFEGVIVKMHYVLQGDSEHTQIVAYNNADFLLHRDSIHGQYRRTYEQETTVFGKSSASEVEAMANEISGLNQLHRIDTPCIFNPEGEFNMSQDTWIIEDVNVGSGTSDCPQLHKGTHIFEVPARYHNTASTDPALAEIEGPTIIAKPWTLSTAVQYVLSTSKSSWAIDPASWSASALQEVFCTNGDPQISNVNLEGKSVQQALRILLEPYNYGYTVSPIPSGATPLQTLTFYYRGAGEEATVTLEDRGTDATDSAANLISYDIDRDYTPIINDISSYGDQIVFTTLAHTNPPTPGMGVAPVLKLEKGWKDSDLVWTLDQLGKLNTWDTTFRKQYCNPTTLISKLDDGAGGFTYPYGVGRYWVVNLGEQPNAALMDLTPALNDNANGVNSIDPRRFEKPEIYDRNTAGGLLHQEDIQVEMSFDSGTHWAVVDKNWWQVSTDSMAVTFVEPHLERLGVKFINASFPAGIGYWDALHTGTLQIRVLCSIKSDERLAEETFNDGTAFPLAIHRDYLNPGYRKVKYNNYINDSVYYTTYAPEHPTTDDRAALAAINVQHLKNTNRQMVSGELRMVLGDFRAFYPGQTVAGIRTLTFNPKPTILRVIYDFPSQHVQLVLDNRFCKTVINTKKSSDATRREHHLGIENPVQQSGNKVPFIPGDERSWKQSLRDGASDFMYGEGG